MLTTDDNICVQFGETFQLGYWSHRRDDLKKSKDSNSLSPAILDYHYANV